MHSKSLVQQQRLSFYCCCSGGVLKDESREDSRPGVFGFVRRDENEDDENDDDRVASLGCSPVLAAAACHRSGDVMHNNLRTCFCRAALPNGT